MKFEDRVVLLIEGGIGDNITSSVMVRNARKKYPNHKIGVCASYGDIFFNNPNVDIHGDYGNPGSFYESFIKNASICKRSRIEKTRVGTDLINRHVTQVWCDLYDVPFDNCNPEVFLTEDEDRQAVDFINQFNKPTVLIQVSGGVMKANQQRVANQRTWIPEEAEEVIRAFRGRACFIQGDLGGKILKGVDWVLPLVPTRNLLALMKHIASFICMDSFWQHASRCFMKKGVVLWGSSNPKNMGYDHNINIYHPNVCEGQPCWRPEGVFMDYTANKDGSLNYWNCPDVKCMKDIRAEEVISSLDKILKEIGV